LSSDLYKDLDYIVKERKRININIAAFKERNVNDCFQISQNTMSILESKPREKDVNLLLAWPTLRDASEYYTDT